jgi:hypothetical protein
MGRSLRVKGRHIGPLGWQNHLIANAWSEQRNWKRSGTGGLFEGMKNDGPGNSGNSENT